MALFKSIGVECVKYVFRCCLCMCACASTLMCAIEAGRATTNGVCSGAYECPLWTRPAPEPSSHLMPVGPVRTHEEKRPHLQANTCKNVHALMCPSCPVAGVGAGIRLRGVQALESR